VLYLRGHETHLFALRAPAEDANREGVQRDDADAVRGGQSGDATRPGAAGGPRGDSLADRPGARVPLGEPFQVVPSHRAPLGGIESGGDLATEWQLVDRREGQVYQWPETLEHYDRYDVYRGETQEEGTVFISLGWAVRCGAWGMDRLYVVSFLSQRAPQTPLAEFLAADDYAETGELIAVIRGSDGGRRMYGPNEALPPAYAQFRIVTYRDRVQARGAWNKLAVVAAETDTDAILNHALIQARRRGDL
jgi:hypothetical protein